MEGDTAPTPTTPLPTVPSLNPSEVSTYGQAIAAVGILLYHGKGGSKTMTMNGDYGRCLMNLEYVHVNNIDGENPGDLFGSVRVDDGWYSYTFYDRNSGNYENVGPGGFATLTYSSRSRAVSGADAFIITVDLFDYDWLSWDDKIAQGVIVWDRVVESVTFEKYDKHLQEQVKGDYGDVTVGYSVLSNALSVTIQVLMENGDGENPVDVYGTLTASQVLGDSTGSITLFDKSSKTYVSVWQWQPVPLLRKVIAASTSTKLTITADLWDYDMFSWDDSIAQDSVDFTVQPGTQSQYIYGKYGNVRVVITCK